MRARDWTALLRDGGVPPRMVARIVDEMRPAARAVPRSGAAARAITSRLGGLPDVGAGFRWPTWDGEILTFVGQLRLRQLPASVRRDLGLPPDGLLSFFYAAEEQPWGNEPEDAGGARVYFWPIENLARAPRSARLPASRLVAPQRLTFVETTTVPDPGSLWAVLAGFKTRAHATWLETIVWWRDKLPSPFHLVGGHAPRLQPSLMELDCALSSAGLDRERLDGRTKRTRDAFRDAEDWTLVFRVDSDERREMWWGDAGALDFWMRRQDIASMSVEHAWCVLETT